MLSVAEEYKAGHLNRTHPDTSRSRDRSIDIAKGILILLVVIYHADVPYHKYVYWFHMPAFFILSGYFFKPLSNGSEFRSYFIKVSRSLLLPYVSYLFLINIHQIVSFLSSGAHLESVKYIFWLGYGGRKIYGINGVYWFITVLYLTRVVVGALSLKFKDHKLALIVVGMFLLANTESLIFYHFKRVVSFPWDADVVLASSFFYFLGYLIRLYRIYITRPIYIICLLVVSVSVLGDLIGAYSWNVDMKRSFYSNLPFISLIPVASTIILLAVSDLIKSVSIISSVFSYLGERSLPIVCLHLFLNIYLGLYMQAHGYPNYDYRADVVLFRTVGIIVPLAFNLLVDRFKMARIIFRGEWKKGS